MTMTMLFGVWNIPNPIPHTAMRHAIFHSEMLAGARSKSNTPTAYTPIPQAAVAPALWRSTNRAARGETIIVASGHGVISRPVVISEKPWVLRNRNGREIIARFWAMNELTDVEMLREYSRMRNRSTGSSGDSRWSCRLT